MVILVELEGWADVVEVACVASVYVPVLNEGYRNVKRVRFRSGRESDIGSGNGPGAR